MSARSELAATIEGALDRSHGIIAWAGPAQEDIADDLLAAGYSKPPPIEPEHMQIVNGWLAVSVDHCTCAGGGSECNYAHENGCGLEPLANITDALQRAGYVKAASK